MRGYQRSKPSTEVTGAQVIYIPKERHQEHSECRPVGAYCATYLFDHLTCGGYGNNTEAQLPATCPGHIKGKADPDCGNEGTYGTGVSSHAVVFKERIYMIGHNRYGAMYRSVCLHCNIVHASFQ